MANTYKNIIITPNTGSNVEDPKIVFSGGNASVNTDIVLKTYPISNGTISIESTTQELFAITNDSTNIVFSINRTSPNNDGIPILEAYANGFLHISPYEVANVQIGRTFSMPYTGDFLFGSNLQAPSFTLTENYSNVLFSVNRTDTAPSLEAYANGMITLIGWGGDLNFGGVGVANMNFIGESVINTSAFVMTSDSTNVIFSINRTSPNNDGIPVLETYANGFLHISPHDAANVQIGQDIIFTPSYTVTDNGSVIFSINRTTDSAPTIEAYANGLITFLPFGGNINFGNSPFTSNINVNGNFFVNSERPLTTGKAIAMTIVFG